MCRAKGTAIDSFFNSQDYNLIIYVGVLLGIFKVGFVVLLTYVIANPNAIELINMDICSFFN
jgi:hypothetical protein